MGFAFYLAVRLASYIWMTRILKNIKDPRYESISNQWQVSKKIGYLMNYLLQGLFMLIVALPFVSLYKTPYKTLSYLITSLSFWF